MIKGTTFKIGDKQYNISFNIRELAQMERDIGRSITSICGQGIDNLLSRTDIDVTVAGLKNGVLYKMGVKPFEATDKAYDLIQAYCDEGGTIDRINALLFNAIHASGLFIPGAKDKAPEEKKNKQ